MSLTVTASESGSTANGLLLRVRVYTAIAKTQNGPSGTQSGVAAHEVNITPTVNGSLLLSVEENGNAGSVDPTTGETTIDGFLDTTNGQGYGTFTTAATGSGGGAPVTGTAFTCGSPDSFNGSAAAFELLPLNTGTAPTLDGSSPSVVTSTSGTSVTTAAFTPPYGSLLVAMVSANGGGAGVVNVAVSDSQGLTWTQKAVGHASGQQLAGIWLAFVPVPGLPPNSQRHPVRLPVRLRNATSAPPTPNRFIVPEASFSQHPLLLAARFAKLPRRVAPTGRPVPIQPPKPGSSGVFPHLHTMRRRTLRGTIRWPGTPPASVQPPWSSWAYRRRWTKPLLPRKGVVPATQFAPPPVIAQLNPTSLRRVQKYQWFRRGSVVPTGLPILVQPPEVSQWLRRWSKPPWPRRGVQPPTNLPEPIPASWQNRRIQKYQWYRRGNAQPNTGLPVPVQPQELPRSVRRSMSLRLHRYGKAAQSAGEYFQKVQPPWSSWSSLRRRAMPPWPRRGHSPLVPLPGAQVLVGYQILPIQTFTYSPGGPGLDLGTLGLTLFPLNKLGFTFWNRYGDVVFIIWNNTPLPIAITPNVIRKVELQSVTLPQYTLAPGIMQAFGPYPYNDFADPQLTTPDVSYFMTIAVEANVSGVYAGAFRMVVASPIGHTGQYDLLGLHLRKLILDHHVHISSTPGDIHPGETTPGA